MQQVSRLPLWTALALALAPGAAVAQAFCSSDGQARPVALLERFINADCEECWSAAGTPRPPPGDLVLDWIVPGSRDAEAPLSAAATRDAIERLDALKRKTPASADAVRNSATPARLSLRVAHGLPVNDYIGTSIELSGAGRGPWSAWLALIETVPAGTEGTPVERNLVRNVLRVDWPAASTGRTAGEPASRFESRSMRLPEGAKAERLRVVGWIDDAAGQIRAIAQSKCGEPPGKG